MSSAIKNDTSINGMKINNSGYLLSQYADDSSLILDECDDSLENLYIIPFILVSFFIAELINSNAKINSLSTTSLRHAMLEIQVLA
jgi:hypothetical protein